MRSKYRGQNTKRSGNSIIVMIMVMDKTRIKGQKRQLVYIYAWDLGVVFGWQSDRGARQLWRSVGAPSRSRVSLANSEDLKKKHTGHGSAGNKSTASSIRMFRVHFITINFPH